MTYSSNLVLWVLTSLLNAGGVVAAAHAWNTQFTKKFTRLLYLVPAFLIAAWLTSYFNTGVVAQVISLTTVALPIRGIATNLAAYLVLGLVFLLLRREAMKRAAAKSSASNSSQSESVPSASLRETVESFLSAADTANVDQLAAAYAPDFKCIRVADAGGFVELTANQVLSFMRRAVIGQANIHHTVPTSKTTVHHAEVFGDSAIVLLTRMKDLGNGFEPLFYTLLWQRTNSDWRLQREIVHQKSAPNWA